MDRVEDRKQQWYVCGRCHYKIFHLKGEDPVVPCPECGWCGLEKSPYDIPAEIKVDLNQFS